MSLSRAVSSTVTCNACRHASIRSFVAPSSNNGAIAARASWTTTSISSQPLPRLFSTSIARRAKKDDLPLPETEPGFDFLESENLPSTQQPEMAIDPTEPSHSTDILLNRSTSTLAENNPPQTSPMPWYLQPQHTPTFSTPPELSARATIPDLPPNPPPLLSTLLEYLSLTAGLDDLALLDLRQLDPPPALGPKLIMIVGTARSEKHLHVSADRFCRHLRREYGLRANAAGLLGRNELKIKLRRKAKRMRMLANVGGREPEGNIDDGIRTGWICCTLGKIEAHPEDRDMPGVDVKEFVGFRDVRPGVNVVVQMFTEEKRGETDLETLWGGVLRTHNRKDAVAEEQLKEIDEHDDKKEIRGEEKAEPAVPPVSKSCISRSPSDPFLEASSTVRQWNRPMPTRGDVFPPASNPNTTHQIRRLHTIGLNGSL